MRSNKVFSVLLFAVISLFAFSADKSSADSAVVKKGDKVSLEYTGTFSDGTVFDSSSKHNSPLKFEVGSGLVIPGFDQAVVGMKVGDSKKITIQPADAYGDVNPELVQQVPRKELPADREPKVGMGLVVGAPGGQQTRAMITAVDAEFITLDMNHPLAGKVLNFDIKLIEISH